MRRRLVRLEVVSCHNKSQTGQQLRALLFDNLLPVAMIVGRTSATLCAEGVSGTSVVGTVPVPRNETFATRPMVPHA